MWSQVWGRVFQDEQRTRTTSVGDRVWKWRKSKDSGKSMETPASMRAEGLTVDLVLKVMGSHCCLGETGLKKEKRCCKETSFLEKLYQDSGNSLGKKQMSWECLRGRISRTCFDVVGGREKTMEDDFLMSDLNNRTDGYNWARRHKRGRRLAKNETEPSPLKSKLVQLLKSTLPYEKLNWLNKQLI